MANRNVDVILNIDTQEGGHKHYDMGALLIYIDGKQLLTDYNPHHTVSHPIPNGILRHLLTTHLYWTRLISLKRWSLYLLQYQETKFV